MPLHALIDVVTSPQPWIGARALWDPAQLTEIVLSRIAPAQIGLCSLGGLLFPRAAGGAAVVRAWDSDPSHPCSGGIVWTEAPSNDDRNTVTTANGALLGFAFLFGAVAVWRFRWEG